MPFRGEACSQHCYDDQSNRVSYFQILLQLEKHEIQIYGFPHSELEQEHHWMRERMPFAVVGSNMTITDPETGLRYRGREYPWGCVNIEDKVSTHFIKSFT